MRALLKCVISKSQHHHFLIVENDPDEAAILAGAFAEIPDCGTVSAARNAK